MRSGTLDAAGIRAFAVALTEAVAERETSAARLTALRDRLVTGALSLDLGITVSGCWTAGDSSDRLPGNAHLLVPGCEGDSLLYLLDAADVECSTGSACQAGVPRPSHVLLAMGYPETEARGRCASRSATPRPTPTSRPSCPPCRGSSSEPGARAGLPDAGRRRHERRGGLRRRGRAHARCGPRGRRRAPRAVALGGDPARVRPRVLHDRGRRRRPPRGRPTRHPVLRLGHGRALPA